MYTLDSFPRDEFGDPCGSIVVTGQFGYATRGGEDVWFPPVEATIIPYHDGRRYVLCIYRSGQSPHSPTAFFADSCSGDRYTYLDSVHFTLLPVHISDPTFPPEHDITLKNRDLYSF